MPGRSADEQRLKRLFHCFECEGEYFLVDVQRQRFFAIHPAVYHLFWGPEGDFVESARASARFGPRTLVKARQFLAELAESSGDGSLPFREEQIIACYRRAPITTVNLIVSYACNLRCSYCYARELVRRAGPPLRMSVEIARRAVDRFLQSCHEAEPRTITFKFSGGGEPLTNSAVVREVIEYASAHRLAKGLDVRFKMSTNGLLLDDAMLRLFEACGGQIKISIDGPREIHQRARFGEEKQAGREFDRLLENIGRALAVLTPSRAVAAITLQRAEDIPEVFSFVLGLGFRRIKSQRAILPETDPVTFDPQRAKGDARIFLTSYLDALRPYLRGEAPLADRPRYEAIDMYLEGINRREHRRHVACYGGLFDCAVAPDGGIYTCNRFAESATHRIGHVSEGLDEARREQFCRTTNIFHRPACQDCWLVYWCGGNCNYQNYVETGSMLQPSPATCCAIRAHFEYLIWFYARLRRDHPEVLRAIVRDGVF